MNRRSRPLRFGAIALGLCVLAACGKKGPPLPPLRYVPGPATDLQLRRSGAEVRLQFRVPSANAEGQGPLALDRLEIYAATVAAGSAPPANRDLLTPKFLVGTIEVRPAAGETPPASGAPPDPRPGAGETAAYVEPLTEAVLTPQITAPALPEAVADVPGAAAAAATVAPAGPRRVYVVRGMTGSRRAGQPSERIVLPLEDPPPPPSAVAVEFTEAAVRLAWTAPAAETAPVFNVYLAGQPAPLNEAPLATPAFERPGITVGTEECFVVRSAVVSGNVSIESAPSAPQCVTPSDIFPPAAPTGLAAVGITGAINLIWNANTESDLAGYLVLRGEAPGDTLQAITPTPIRDTTFRDTAVTPGVRYVYAIVAVDRATPPNTSAQSGRVEEAAR